MTTQDKFKAILWAAIFYCCTVIGGAIGHYLYRCMTK